ncbi:MAG: PQQ-like beta-propeller repeat protein [Coleofasciculaceae cyanobacterium SM2_3_26]|nr:PQQ-like beta-propeller repeat protein [Coleofasciculaceae cyanobacterium SM2_3_26]
MTTLLATLDGSVGTVDRSTGEFRRIATGPAFTDIAATEDGDVFGITFDDLYRIDANSGTIRRQGRLNGATSFNGLAFDEDDRLYAIAEDSTALFRIDPNTGTTTFAGSLGFEFFSSGDLVFDPDRDRLYATSRGASSDVLFEIDLTSGGFVDDVDRVGSIGFRDVWGLAVENGVLTGYTINGQRLTIDPRTGNGTPTGQVFGLPGQIAGAAEFQGAEDSDIILNDDLLNDFRDIQTRANGSLSFSICRMATTACAWMPTSPNNFPAGCDRSTATTQ